MEILKDKRGYIDPGTAGMVVGGTIWPIIVAFFAAIGGFFIKYFWKPIKGFFKKEPRAIEEIRKE